MFLKPSFVSFPVDITLQNAAIFVNFPFLFSLLDFFVSPPQGASENVQRIATASQTDRPAAFVSVSEVEGPYLPHTEERLLDAVDFISEVDAGMLEAPSGLKIKAHCVVKEPEIFFLSDATKKDSEALIVQVSKQTLHLWKLYLWKSSQKSECHSQQSRF